MLKTILIRGCVAGRQAQRHGKAPDRNEGRGFSGSGWGEPVTEGSAVTTT